MKPTTAALLSGLLVLVASAGLAATPDAETVWPTVTWPVAAPEEQGMDSVALAQLVDTIGWGYKQDSLLIIRHGRIVVEAYYAPYAAGIRHDLRSVTKSFIGTLTAIEIQRGLLEGVDRPVVDLFPDRQISNLDENKRAMTVQALLDMTSGIRWLERFYTPDETIMQMYRSPDRTAFVLNQPLTSVPGTQFYYNGGNPYVLSALINKRTGKNAFEFAQEELFGPLGIHDVRWGRVDAQGVTNGEAGLFLTPPDMAKLGYLYLHEGVWDGRQVIPSSWVDRVRQGTIAAGNGFHYANLWWSLPAKDAYMAQGRHSQLILVLPKRDVVAVTTGISPHFPIPVAWLTDSIADSVKSDTSLPSHPDAQSLLAASVRAAATEKPSLVGATPDLAKAISGRSYRFGDNALHVATMSLTLLGPHPTWEATFLARKAEEPPQRFGGPSGSMGSFARVFPPATGSTPSRGAGWTGTPSRSNAAPWDTERRRSGR